MKDKGVEFVQFIGAYQQPSGSPQAMQQQGFKPDVFLQTRPIYDRRLRRAGGDAVDGTCVFINFVPFEEATATRRCSSTGPGCSR